MVDAVHERDHRRVADALRRRECERLLELGRFRGDPEDIDLAIECRCCGYVDSEVSEHGAFEAWID